MDVCKNYKNYFILISLFLGMACQQPNDATWEIYGGSHEKTHYILQTEIRPENVQQLEKVWEYSSGDAGERTQIQTNPIVIGQTLYGVSPKLKLFALEATRGIKKWEFDPFDVSEAEQEAFNFSMNVCRGVTYYKNDRGEETLFYAAGSQLYAVNAKTGTLQPAFGADGKIDLHLGLGERAASLYVSMTSPGVIYKNLLIVGSRVNEANPAAPGSIRAINADTGALVWTFHTIPQTGEKGHESWENPEAWKNAGGANVWSGFSLDAARGILYAATGSASYDFFGADRLGDNLFANSIIAIDAQKGSRVWHYQTVHHDVWDRDLPAPPILFDYTLEGEKIPALAQLTKTGYVFLLNRTNGKPIFPIKEKPVPTDTFLEGEQLSPTQPLPDFPQTFSRQRFNAETLNPFVDEEEKKTLTEALKSYRNDHVFAPPTERGTIIFPGYDGGAEWGGAALDPTQQMLYVNANEMAWILTMQVVAAEDESTDASSLYTQNCMACHGVNFEGSGDFPSLVNPKQPYTFSGVKHLLQQGKNRMPSFGHLSKKALEALAHYVLQLKKGDRLAIKKSTQKKQYRSTGYIKFLTENGYPAIAPPWGTLNAINLKTGAVDWKIPLGNTPIGKEKGIITGTENYGGPLVTSTGILFIAGTKDKQFRAYDKNTGSLLWETTLPFSGFATPSFYSIHGKSYIVIACGGGKLGAASGDAYVAYALPTP